MAEIAILSARKTRLKQMAESGDAGAAAALELASDPTRFLSTVQIGITLVNVLTGAFGGALFADWIADRIRAVALLSPYAHSIGIAIVVLGLAYVSLIFGELAPKRLALNNAEAIAARMAATMRRIAIVARPFSWFLHGSTDAVLRLFPSPPATPTVSDEEIKILMREGAEAGHFHAAESAIVEMALRLGDQRVSALMVPRTQMAVIDLEDSPDENRRAIIASPYSRLPAVRNDPNNVIGILHLKDLVTVALSQSPLDLPALLRQPLYIPDTAPALRALELFKQSGDQLALIVDEYGDIEGLVTLNDVLEALIGDIGPADADSAAGAVLRDDGSWLVDGLMSVDEALELVGAARPPVDPDAMSAYQTLGGMVMAMLKRIPNAGDIVLFDDYRLEVVAMQGRRVAKVTISTARHSGSRHIERTAI